MTYCLFNDCDNFQTVRPCCLYCDEQRECPEKCRKGSVEGCRNAYERMSEEEAKTVLRNDPYGNIRKRFEAIETAKNALGECCTMADIWRWADAQSEGIPVGIPKGKKES